MGTRWIAALVIVLVAGSHPAASSDRVQNNGHALLADCRDSWGGGCGRRFAAYLTRQAMRRTALPANAACLPSASTIGMSEQRRFQREAVRWLKRHSERLDDPAMDLVPEIAAVAFPCR
ncbi:MAG: hypothetical protein FJX67_01805 [Alphaproteobacteria bacterium]|nr:hypothetical protein [Alphaproteobacteria bacterium]